MNINLFFILDIDLTTPYYVLYYRLLILLHELILIKALIYNFRRARRRQ